MLFLFVIIFLIAFVLGTTVYFLSNTMTEQKRNRIINDITVDMRRQKRNRVRAGK